MLGVYFTDEEKTEGHRNVVLQRCTENSMDRAIKEVLKKMTHTQNQGKTADIPWKHSKETRACKTYLSRGLSRKSKSAKSCTR